MGVTDGGGIYFVELTLGPRDHSGVTLSFRLHMHSFSSVVRSEPMGVERTICRVF